MILLTPYYAWLLFLRKHVGWDLKQITALNLMIQSQFTDHMRYKRFLWLTALLQN